MLTSDQSTLLAQSLQHFGWRAFSLGFRRSGWEVKIHSMSWRAVIPFSKCPCPICSAPFFFHAFLKGKKQQDSCFALPLESADPGIQALQIATALTQWVETRA